MAGINLNAYLPKLDNPAACGNPAADFSQLGRLLADRYRLSAQQAPIVIGYGAGAALAYAVLAQVPANAIHAGISIDGGWAELDRTVAAKLAARGVPGDYHFDADYPAIAALILAQTPP